jgi:cyclase
VVSQAAQRLSVPLVIVGGVGSLKHVRQGLHHGAQAVGAGSFFVFQGNRQAVLVTYPDRLTLDSLLD